MLLKQLETIKEIVKFYNDGEEPEIKNTLNLDILCRIKTNWESMEYILCELDEKMPIDILFSHQKVGDYYEITFRTTKTNDIIKEILKN